MTTARRSSFPRAFTLIEILVVISIIVLALSLAVPTINVLQGNRSLETAQNDISAYLGIARNDAIYNRQSMGVCFYIDLVTQQTAMVEVAQVPTSVFSNSAWTTANPSATALDIAGTFNTQVSPATLTAYRDVQLLSKGVSVALYSVPGTNSGVDHLVRMGVIMFDQYGTVTQMQYGIPQSDQTTTNIANSLAKAIGATTDLPPNGFTMTSSPGFVIYDHQLYLSQGFATYPDADIQYQASGQTAPTAGQKATEENWIAGNYASNYQGNGISLMVNQFNGTLVKGK